MQPLMSVGIGYIYTYYFSYPKQNETILPQFGVVHIFTSLTFGYYQSQESKVVPKPGGCKVIYYNTSMMISDEPEVPPQNVIQTTEK